MPRPAPFTVSLAGLRKVCSSAVLDKEEEEEEEEEGAWVE